MIVFGNDVPSYIDEGTCTNTLTYIIICLLPWGAGHVRVMMPF